MSLVLGSLAPVFAALFVAEASGRRLAGALTGATVALQPLFIRFSGEMNRQMQVLALASFAPYALARHHRRGTTSPLLLFVAASVLCLETRPESFLLVVPCLSYSLIVPAGRRRSGRGRGRLARAGLAHAAVCVVVIAELAGGSNYVFSSGYVATFIDAGLFVPCPPSTVWLDPRFTSMAFVALAVLGLVLGVYRRDRLVVWSAVALYLVSWPSSRVQPAHLDLASARYATLAILLFCVLAAQGAVVLVDWCARQRSRLRALGLAATAAAVLVSSLPPLRVVLPPRTIDREYAFVREQVRALPADATIYYVYSDTEDMGLRPGRYLPTVLGLPRQRWLPWPPTTGPLADNSFYYHTGSCSFDADPPPDKALTERARQDIRETLRRCRRAWSAHGAHPRAEATLPAAPFTNDWYATETLRVGSYEMPPRISPR